MNKRILLVEDDKAIGRLMRGNLQFEGFDVEFVKAITRAVLGDESKLELRPVTAASGISSLQDGSIDLAAAAMTITLDRKNQIDFSEVYYQAGDRILVRGDAPYATTQDLGGKNSTEEVTTAVLAKLA